LATIILLFLAGTIMKVIAISQDKNFNNLPGVFGGKHEEWRHFRRISGINLHSNIPAVFGGKDDEGDNSDVTSA
jgi:hypothetical protein